MSQSCWPLEPLSHVATLQRGYDLPESQRRDGKYPIISSAGITGSHDDFKVKGPGVITGRYGSIGGVFFVEEDFWPLNTTLWVKDFHENDERFISYLLSSIDFRKYSDKTSVPGVNRNDLHKIEVPCPPKHRQRAIVALVSTWDDAIEQTRKLIDAKKLCRKALMHQLVMGKKRLTRFVRSRRTRHCRLFDLPEDWKCPQMKEIGSESTERNTDHHKLKVFSCSKHHGFVESSQYFGKQVFSDDTSNYKVVHHGWFGYPSNHIEEGSIGFLFSSDIGLVSPIYTVFSCNDSIISQYLFAVFKTDTFRHIFASMTNASVDRRGSLRWKEFSLIRVPMPSREEQNAIVDVLKAAEAEVTHLEAKLKALEKQKRGLMQKLLTGEIRVEV